MNINENLEKAIGLRQSGNPAEAKTLLEQLLRQEPVNASVWYQCAWTHDVMGLEKEAVPFYEKALELGLGGEEREGALLGLGSTYRTLGLYNEAERLFAQANLEYPENKEFQVFRAMVKYNLKAYSEGMELLLKLLAETSADPGIQAYKRAILFYADKLDERWD
ncbi:tetratricopeptide repeat protein [Paenibacillus physcomitrellae]|uniref:Tetratrico peptide repeat group 5 domain-containing protein n=1 Tax=Paenibacillus physcomitrellae TaxID=1619311 RepID=A0ABQ1FQH6_9BACL|nr:tetratricopeptide repeat protein [Paenibacillus physcomitrellae]GGA24207.1 hypothetical protein GCM10010917_06290 [Paenibacillus physcomitrellae]